MEPLGVGAVTTVDRPDNGQDEGRSERGTDLRGLRLGMGIGTPAALASARAGAGEQQREMTARWLADHYGEPPVRALDPWRADAAALLDLLALLDRTQSDDDPGPQCPSTSHDTDGGWRCAVEGPHGDGEHGNAAGDVTW